MGSKTTRIEVTARFDVRFYRNINAAEFAALQDGTIEISDLVDESEAYAQASTGDCEMDWDYTREAFAPQPKAKTKLRRTR